MTSTHCDFCNELSGGAENSFAQIYGARPATRVLFRSNRFAVLPSIGQLVEGYLLVLPINHFKALGDLSSTHVAELATISNWIGEILKQRYGSYILFEHGTRAEGVGGCGIYHAHLHAVPLSGIPDPVDGLKLKFHYIELGQLDEISKRSVGLSTYLFYRDSEARLYLFDTGPLPSQYMRKLLADSLGISGWNWRTAAREDRLLATIERLVGRFEINGKGNSQPVASKCHPAVPY